MSKFYVRSKKIVQICDRIVLFSIRLNTSQCNEPNIFFSAPPPPLQSLPFNMTQFLIGRIDALFTVRNSQDCLRI